MLAKWTYFLLQKPSLQTVKMKLMFTRAQFSKNFPNLKVTIANSTVLLIERMLLLNLNFRQRINLPFRQPLTNRPNLLLQLQQLLIGHLVRINIMFILRLKPHAQNEVIEIFRLALIDVLDVLAFLLVLLLYQTYFML